MLVLLCMAYIGSRGKDKCNGSKCGSEFPPAPSTVCGDATIALYPSCLCAFIAEHRVGYFRAAGTYWGCGDWFSPVFADCSTLFLIKGAGYAQDFRLDPTNIFGVPAPLHSQKEKPSLWCSVLTLCDALKLSFSFASVSFQASSHHRCTVIRISEIWIGIL